MPLYGSIHFLSLKLWMKIGDNDENEKRPAVEGGMWLGNALLDMDEIISCDGPVCVMGTADDIASYSSSITAIFLLLHLLCIVARTESGRAFFRAIFHMDLENSFLISPPHGSGDGRQRACAGGAIVICCCTCSVSSTPAGIHQLIR